MLIGLAVTLFGWGVTWGSLGGKVNGLEEDKKVLEQTVLTITDENHEQDIKISRNADADAYIIELMRILFGESGPEDGEGQD